MIRRHFTIFTLASGLLLTALVVPFFPHAARADVVRLRSGENIKGRPIAHLSTDDLLIIEDLISGNVRALDWSLVEQADRERLLFAWGRTHASLAPVAGQRLTLRLHGGGEQVLRGLIVAESETHYSFRRAGKVLEIERPRVLQREPEMLDPRDIWSPLQIVARYEEEILAARTGPNAPLSSEALFRLGSLAREVGAFEEAARHFAACAGDTGFRSAGLARSRLAEMRVLLREKEAVQALRAIRRSISLKAYRRVREKLAAFDEAYPKPGDAVRAQRETVESEFARRRSAHFERQARIHFPKLVLRSIAKRAVHRTSDFADIRLFARRGLADEAFKSLAASWKKTDDVTPEEARVFWANRSKSGWRTARYGAGTFIVQPVHPQPTKARPKPRLQGGGPSVSVPKPPTRDSWWAAAKTMERTQWVMAWFVEHGDLFEVAPRPKYTDCPLCHGRGRLTLRTPGGVHHYLCTRCAGTRRDKRVRYR